jgi:hypothetical protein
MIPNLFPGFMGAYSQYICVFNRSAGGDGIPDNYDASKTVIEMFDVPTTYPVFLYVVIPSNCHVYDNYGYHDTDGIVTYDYATSPAALRFDGIHPDSLVYIINYGGIYGAGGDGGMGSVESRPNTITSPTAWDVGNFRVGGGGGAGQGYLASKGGMQGWGHGAAPTGSQFSHYMHDQDPTYDWDYLGVDHELDDGYDSPAGDGDNCIGYADVGSRSGGSGISSWTETFVTLLNDTWEGAGYSFLNWKFIPPPESYIAEACPWRTWGIDAYEVNYAWYFLKLTWMGRFFAKEYETDSNIWRFPDQSGPIPGGYHQDTPAIYRAKPGTSSIILACDTWIHQGGEIYAGGGGGVGGDSDDGGSEQDGGDGGDWGEAGTGSNKQGHVGGAAGLAVDKQGHDLVWTTNAGLKGPDVKGEVA